MPVLKYFTPTVPDRPIVITYTEKKRTRFLQIHNENFQKSELQFRSTEKEYARATPARSRRPKSSQNPSSLLYNQTSQFSLLPLPISYSLPPVSFQCSFPFQKVSVFYYLALFGSPSLNPIQN